MTRPVACSILGLSLALAAAPLLAQTIYQWKDGKGVTHYSDAPPPKGATRREIRGTGRVIAAEAKGSEADNANCAQAKLNLTQLQSKAEVGLDKDRDGKIDAPMSAEARARQVLLVREAIKVHCSGGV